MGTRLHRAWRVKAALTAILVTAACNGGSSAGVSTSPSPSSSASGLLHSPSPSASSNAYGVLVGSQLQNTYTVSLVGIDGRVAASAEASTPHPVSCGDMSTPIPLLPVSTSNSRAYYMDASGAVSWVAPNGKSAAPIVTLPAPTTTRRTMFAVSPDDQQMAVVVTDFPSTDATATTNLYMFDLNKGETQRLLYTQTGARTLWPVGWHGTDNLIVAAAPTSCVGSEPFCCGMQELHVVDPATADRRFTLGSWGRCPIAGAPSPAGVVCENLPLTGATVLSWTATTLRSLRFSVYVSLYLSPNGANVATVDRSGTGLWNWEAARFDGKGVNGTMFACSWIDDTHLLGKGAPNDHAWIADITDGHLIPVAAAGDCGGRLPGGL
jgi:hypothetical protein